MASQQPTLEDKGEAFLQEKINATRRGIPNEATLKDKGHALLKDEATLKDKGKAFLKDIGKVTRRTNAKPTDGQRLRQPRVT